METDRRESDQLPEEAPADQVPEDVPRATREGAEETRGRLGEEQTATGNPRAAGAQGPDD